jgi:hypothetical protein
MEALDVVEDIRPGLGLCLVPATIDAFAFQHPEEALGGGIVGTAPNTAHTADQIMSGEKALVLPAGKGKIAFRQTPQLRAAPREFANTAGLYLSVAP